jgi:hypothetical protein
MFFQVGVHNDHGRLNKLTMPKLSKMFHENKLLKINCCSNYVLISILIMGPHTLKLL